MGILPNCKDPAVSALKSRGYGVVALPRVNLRPTQLLVSDGKRLTRLGELHTVFPPVPGGQAVPPISSDLPAPNIDGTISNNVDAGIGLNILGGLISALGGSTLGINIAYKRARWVQFEYSDVIENSCDPALIDIFLAGTPINALSLGAKKLINKDKGFVVTSTLKSRKIRVSAKDDQNNSIAIDLPVVQQAIGANLKIGAVSGSTTLVEYEAAIPLVFAFQAIQLDFENGNYAAYKPVNNPGYSAEMVAAGEAEPDPHAPVYASVDLMLGASEEDD